MNYFYKILQIIIFIIFFSFAFFEDNSRINNTDQKYEELLKWGLNHSLKINNKIKLVTINDEKHYISTDDIIKGEVLLTIPKEITLSLNDTLSLINSTNINKKYKKYKSQFKKSNSTSKVISDIEISFMSYLLYKINKTKNNEYKNFYDYYKPLFYIFEDDLSHLPTFFNHNQKSIFLNKTYYGSAFSDINYNLAGEIELFEKKIFKKKIKLEDYLRYRFILVKKTYDISKKKTIVPFIDLIKRDFNMDNINCKLTKKKGNIKIKATKSIKKGEILTIKPNDMTNQYSFTFYGETYDELIGLTKSFIIPAISDDLLADEGIDIDLRMDSETNMVDLAWDDFYEAVLPIYGITAQELKMDNSDYNLYTLFLKYLKMIRRKYDNIDLKKIEDVFNNDKDKNNVKRIIKGEIKFLDEKIKVLKKVIKNKKKEQNVEDL